MYSILHRCRNDIAVLVILTQNCARLAECQSQYIVRILRYEKLIYIESTRRLAANNMTFKVLALIVSKGSAKIRLPFVFNIL